MNSSTAKKVREALPFSAILKRDKKNRPTLVQVPGTEGKTYNVIIRRLRVNETFSKITLECNLVVGIGYISCLGNSPRKGTHVICKHSRTALNLVLFEAGRKVRWFDSYEAAVKMRMGGKIYCVESHQSEARAYVVTNEIKK